MGFSDEEQEQAATLRQELVDYLQKQDHIRTPEVEQAFRTVPRHLFLPGVELQRVYSDTYVATKLENEIPISSSSQPAIMAYMLEQLDLRPGLRVLEIGAGTGYNAALMAQIVGTGGEVVTIDIDQDIVVAAQEHLRAAGYDRVRVICADGSEGYTGLAPYDRVILTVSADDITPAWREQLTEGGIMVLPFKFTQFRSILSLSNVLPSVDQIVLTLRNTGGYLQSIRTHGGGFMPLRGIFAVRSGRQVTLSPDKRLLVESMQDCDWPALARHLEEPYRDIELGIKVTYTDLWGLRTWLNLREPAYCELLKRGGEGEQFTNIPSLVQANDGSAASYGLCQDENIALLMRPAGGRVDESDYWLEPFELLMRAFGPQDELAQRLSLQIQAWHAASRPFQWHQWDLLQNISIRVYPTTSTYAPGPRELLSARKGSHFIFAW